VFLVEDHQAGGVEGALHEVEVFGAEAEFVEQFIADFGGAVPCDFESDGGAAAAALEFFLHGGQQVGHLFLVDIEFAVSGDPKGPPTLYGAFREEVGEEMADDVAEEDVVRAAFAAGQAEEPGEDTWDFEDDESGALVGAAGAAESDDQVEGAIGQEWEGVGRVNGQRGEDRSDHGLVVV
jgi:hypothetical protein